MAIHPGDPAPDFTTQAHNGQQVRLADYQHVADTLNVVRALVREG